MTAVDPRNPCKHSVPVDTAGSKVSESREYSPDVENGQSNRHNPTLALPGRQFAKATSTGENCVAVV
jgi:hypothetical protein